MVKKYIVPAAFAIFCAGAVASAQSTAAPQQPPQTQPPAAMDHATTTTVEGCIYREQDVPGRSPNVAERAGVLEDYILVVSPSAGTGTAVGTSGTTGSAGSAVAPKMFKLEHADDSKLSAMVGKRVRVVGKVDAERGDMKSPISPTSTTPPTGTAPQADRSLGPDKIELPELEVTSITESTGTCPPKPEIKK